MLKVIVTGGAGYIGAHLCKYLASKECMPIVVDSLTTGHRDFVKWGPFEECDVRDSKKLFDIFERYRPDLVMHLAGSCYVEESEKNPMKYYDNNFIGTISLLNTMEMAGVKNIVFSSSCATYGNPDKNESIAECVRQNPINTYGRTKYVIEGLLRDVSRSTELNFIGLRYFNAAGADRYGEIGEWHSPETHLIPLAINASMKGHPFKVFGNKFHTPDGSAVRDFIHVEDLAKAHYLAMKYLLRNKKSDFINIGTGLGSSVFQILSCIRENGLDLDIEIAEPRIGDPPYLVADTTKAIKLLAFHAEYSDLTTIIKTAIRWHLKLQEYT
jgi:UDP-glucose 4-epimerase